MASPVFEIDQRVKVFESGPNEGFMAAGVVENFAGEIDGEQFFDVRVDHGHLWTGLSETRLGDE